MLSPLGTAVNGAKAWINLPAGFQVEPSEFAKIALILMAALVFGELRDSGRIPRPRDAAGGAAWPRSRSPWWNASPPSAWSSCCC